VHPRAGLADAVVRRIPCHSWESYPTLAVHSLVTILTELPQLCPLPVTVLNDLLDI